jgi:multiple sugar transport system substrate-binding protein
MKHHSLKAAGLMAATALVLAACSGGNAEPAAEEAATADPNAEVTLNFTWWGNDDRASR